MEADVIKIKEKEFRTYLRTVEDKHGISLASLINAAKNNLPQLINERFLPSFSCLYEDENDIRLLVQVAFMMDKDSNFVTETGGYISQKCLNLYIKFYCYKNNLNLDEIKKEVEKDMKEEEDQTLEEGEATKSSSTRYERNPKARKKCLDYYGCKCYVCGIDMEKEYGSGLGRGAIEVHHIIPVSQRGGSYIINPIKDLRPLCPNCHAIVHRKRDEVMDVDELKTTYNRLHQQK